MGGVWVLSMKWRRVAPMIASSAIQHLKERNKREGEGDWGKERERERERQTSCSAAVVWTKAGIVPFSTSSPTTSSLGSTRDTKRQVPYFSQWGGLLLVSFLIRHGRISGQAQSVFEAAARRAFRSSHSIVRTTTSAQRSSLFFCYLPPFCFIIFFASLVLLSAVLCFFLPPPPFCDFVLLVYSAPILKVRLRARRAGVNLINVTFVAAPTNIPQQHCSNGLFLNLTSLLLWSLSLMETRFSLPVLTTAFQEIPSYQKSNSLAWLWGTKKERRTRRRRKRKRIKEKDLSNLLNTTKTDD